MSQLPCAETTVRAADQQGCVGASKPRCRTADIYRGRGHLWRPHCVVCGLERAANAVLHPLPAARKPERQAWIDFVRRNPGHDMHDWTPPTRRSSYVCSLHFAPCCIHPMKVTDRSGALVYEKHLKPGAVPTIYPKPATADARGAASDERGIDVGPNDLDDNQEKLTRGSFTFEEEAYLIELVKERPLLWERTHVNHFNQELKGVAYGQIASAFRGKFSVPQLRKKFLILRSTFMEEKRKLRAQSEAKPGIAPQSHWVHYKRLMFLADCRRTEECAMVLKEEDQEQGRPNDTLGRGGPTTGSSLELDIPKQLGSECFLRGASSQQSTQLIALPMAEELERGEKQLMEENYMDFIHEAKKWCHR